MCTVTWLRQPNGYVLLCNRDERKARKPASGPQIIKRNEFSFIVPADGDHGGSWIGVNEFGLTICLLNRYGDPATEICEEYTSRGMLMTELLDCRQSQRIPERVSGVRLDRFRPFTMLALSSDEPAMLIDWTGRHCTIQRNAEAQMPLTSSSLNNSALIAARRSFFQELARTREKLDAELLHEFHLSHRPERGPYSVCMHRDDAETVSLSALTVSRESIEFVYQPGSPCLKLPAEKVRLRRSQMFRDPEAYFSAAP